MLDLKMLYSKNEIKEKINKKEKISINDDIIKGIKEGKYDNYIIREGLCGVNLTDNSIWDLSGLSPNMLKYISFDEKTQFPEELKEEANKIMEKSKVILDEIEELHKKGFDGSGRTIVLVDTPFEINEENDKNIRYYETEENIEKENHGRTVASIIQNIVPNANIIAIASDKRKSVEEQKGKIEELLNNIDINDKNNCDIISNSSPMDLKELNSDYENMNSTIFNNKESGCRYGFVDQDRKTLVPANCESEGRSRKDFESVILSNLKVKGFDYNEINKENAEKIINIIKAMNNLSEEEKKGPIESIEKLKFSEEVFRINSIQEDKTITPGLNADKDSVCVPSAGISVRQNDNKFKYIATNSTSFSVPIVSSLFVIARQVNPEITLDKFLDVVKNNDKKNLNVNYKVISPINVIVSIIKEKNSNIKSWDDIKNINKIDKENVTNATENTTLSDINESTQEIRENKENKENDNILE